MGYKRSTATIHFLIPTNHGNLKLEWFGYYLQNSLCTIPVISIFATITCRATHCSMVSIQLASNPLFWSSTLS